MGDIEKVFNINYQELIISIFIIIFAVVATVTILGKFFKIIGKPIKWFKGKDADHDLLIKTAYDFQLYLNLFQIWLKWSISNHF